MWASAVAECDWHFLMIHNDKAVSADFDMFANVSYFPLI